MNTYIYTGGSSLLTMKDNDIKNFDTIIRNEDFYNNYKLNKEYNQACVKEA